MATPEKYWFKRRRYGYGWTPVTWQGWTAITFYLLLVALGALALSQAPPEMLFIEAGIYAISVVVGAAVLLIVSSKKGPKAKWRWGKTKNDNPREDF